MMRTSTARVVTRLECAVLRDRDVVDVVDPDQHRCFVLAGLNEVVLRGQASLAARPADLTRAIH